jgi:hypothetical protein
MTGVETARIKLEVFVNQNGDSGFCSNSMEKPLESFPHRSGI